LFCTLVKWSKNTSKQHCFYSFSWCDWWKTPASTSENQVWEHWHTVGCIYYIKISLARTWNTHKIFSPTGDTHLEVWHNFVKQGKLNKWYKESEKKRQKYQNLGTIRLKVIIPHVYSWLTISSQILYTDQQTIQESKPL
jgi:hypothetical protein